MRAPVEQVDEAADGKRGIRDREARAVRAVRELGVRAVAELWDARLARVVGLPDRPPRRGIEEAHRAVVLGDRERAAVGAEDEREQRVAIAAQHADRGGTAQQRREQVAARGRRVDHVDCLAREQQLAVKGRLGQRLHVEHLRRGGALPRACAGALVQRDDAGDDGGHEQQRHAGQDRAQPAVGALVRGPAGVEERPLGGVQLLLVAGAPVERRRQPRAAVQHAGVASVGIPRAGGVADLMVQAPTLDVVVQPFAQARPFAQERLVRDLDGTV